MVPVLLQKVQYSLCLDWLKPFFVTSFVMLTDCLPSAGSSPLQVHLPEQSDAAELPPCSYKYSLNRILNRKSIFKVQNPVQTFHTVLSKRQFTPESPYDSHQSGLWCESSLTYQ